MDAIAEKPQRSMGSHQRTLGMSQTWLTPPEILAALGPFDLDPCACPEPRPWMTATRMIALPGDGLKAEWWSGERVWCNPPFGPASLQRAFMQRMVEHGNGIALLAARTETNLFFDTVWRPATAVLFLRGRPHFHRADGTRALASSGAPICLIAYGGSNAMALLNSGLTGQFVRLRGA